MLIFLQPLSATEQKELQIPALGTHVPSLAQHVLCVIIVFVSYHEIILIPGMNTKTIITFRIT
jgi:hypothetical protein